MINLPEPAHQGKLSVEAAFKARKSIRNYSTKPLSLEQVSQLLWAAQGISGPGGRRTAPSAGALYPLEVYLVTGQVEGLEPGVYHYLPRAHGLEPKLKNDLRNELASAALGQTSVAVGAVSLIIAAVYERTAIKYSTRAERYVHMEVGNVSQNISLQAVALNVGTVVIGAFYDEKVKRILRMAGDEVPLCIMPVGRLG